MSNNDDIMDLPVPLRVDDLPIPLPDAAPRHEIVFPSYSQWLNLASQNHIRSLAIDPARGDLWLATGGGILRWWTTLDRFTRYASEHGLPGNSIKLVAVDGNGQQWAVPENSGLSYLHEEVWQPYLPLAETLISCLTIDGTGKLWLGTGIGLYLVETPESEPILVELPLHSTPPRSIAITTAEDIWLCTAQGVFHYQTTWKSYNHLPTILQLSRQGNNLWLGTMDGLIRIDLGTGQSHPVGEPHTEISAMVPTSEGVWAACDLQVGFATETSWTTVSGKACNLVTSIAPAKDEGVWIGTHSGLQFANSTTNRFQLTESPPDVVGGRSPSEIPITFSNLVQTLEVQHLQNTALLWIGTARGLFRVDLSTETWRRLGSLQKQDIRSVAVDASTQNFWVASWSSGLHESQGSASLISAPNIADSITTLFARLDAGCWVGGLAGVHWYDGSTWTLVVSAKKLPESAWVRAIAQPQPNYLWIGTSVGLFTYNLDTKILSPVPGALGSTHIRSLLTEPSEKQSTVLVGTQRGLYYGQLEGMEIVNGLENRAITAMRADEKNHKVWVGTDRGLFGLSHANDTWEISDQFDVDSSGLAHHSITALAIDTSKIDRTRLWIGTPCGLSAYTYTGASG
jgi:ligand-binding sensor domain-containing protein